MKLRIVMTVHALGLLLLFGCGPVKEPTSGSAERPETGTGKQSEVFTLPAPYISAVKPSENACVAPPLAAEVPKAEALPDTFSAPKNGNRRTIGNRSVLGIALEKHHGTYPIYIIASREGIFPGDPLLVGDVVLAVNGKPLGKDPIARYRTALREGREGSGVVWVTRWRKGTVSRCMIDLGLRPLDLTKTGAPGATRDWALGPIGANGWGFNQQPKYGASSRARQLIITLVEKGTPADGKLRIGDVIVGVDGKKFDRDVRRALAAAINEAEKEENKGELRLLVWRPSTELGAGKGKEMEVSLTLPVMGSYSATTPFNCPKTDKIIDNAVGYIKRNKNELLKPSEKGWISYINALGLLATGRDDVLPMVREFAHASLLKEGEKLSVEKHVSMMCWWWSYKTIFLCEYYLRTGDKAVLPTVEELATKIAMGQSGAGTWGHTYAARENAGHLHGHLGGYGAINQMGLTLMIALPLAEKCGVNNSEVRDAIKRGDDFFSYFIGRGTIPYGDHGPAHWYDDNGKSGAAAIVFDLLGNREGTDFFSEMVLASAPSGRESGHTGHFWSHLWGGMGAARGGDASLQLFMKEMNYIFTLERQYDGRMVFQRNIGEAGERGKPKTKWDCTGARLLQLCVPRRALYITGRETPRDTRLTQERVNQIFEAGRLDVNKEARGRLSREAILKLLQAPLPPTRAMAANALAERDINCVDKLVEMLESDNKYAQYGAAQALCKAGFGSKEAADKLIALMQSSNDITFKSYAIDALINRDTKRGLLSVAKPAIPVLLKMAVEHSPDDPRQVLQQQIALALFYKWTAQPRVGLLHKYGLNGVDRSLLIPAIKEILTNQNGAARSLVRWVYSELTADELDQLWGDIYQSTYQIAPSGIMFASDIRTAGLHTMADHHVKEGLDLAVWYLVHQKRHGSPGRVPTALDAILKYGPHAKRVIPKLEQAREYWVNWRTPGRPIGPKDPARLIRKAIDEIKAMPDKSTVELESIAEQIEKLKTAL